MAAGRSQNRRGVAGSRGNQQRRGSFPLVHDHGGARRSVGVVGLVTLPVFGTDRTELVAWTIGVFVLVSGLWVMARAPFLRVSADGQGLRVYGLLRCQRYPWGQVVDLRLEVVDEVLGLLRVYAPVRIRKDGGERPLRLLAGYSTCKRPSRTRMARQTALLRQHRPPSGPGRTDSGEQGA